MTAGSWTYYRGAFIYSQPNGGDEQLDQILHPEGFVKKSGANYVYHYFVTDHAGNVRAVLQATGAGTQPVRVQKTDYYPYGLAHQYDNVNLNKYLHSGKELQAFALAGAAWGGPGTGTLNLFDFGSRYYNPVLGRWANIDPALQFANPYLYAANNPVMYTDPDGEFVFSLLLPGIGTVIDIALWSAVGGIQANRNGGDFFDGMVKAFAFSGIGTVTSQVAGNALGNMFGNATSIGGGALRGAASGAVSGFASGSTQGWFSGASFSSGLKQGLKGAGYGAASGAISGGIQAGRLKANFKAAFPDASGEPLVASDATLDAFSDEYFPDYKYRDKVYHKYASELKSAGQVDNRLRNGKYEVRFGNKAFGNDFKMYMTMGHEYVHVAHYINISNVNVPMSETAAYDWNLNLTRGNSRYGKIHEDFKNSQSIYKNQLGNKTIPDTYHNYGGWGIPSILPRAIQ